MLRGVSDSCCDYKSLSKPLVGAKCWYAEFFYDASLVCHISK